MFVKRFLGVCTAVVMMFSMTASVYALDTSSDVPVQISEFADIVGLRGLNAPRPIYSPDEELFGYCAEGTNCYIIYDTEYNMVEYSDSKLSEYHDVTSTLYYGGPLAYYVKENDQFRHLQSGELYSVNDFRSNDEFERQIEANETSLANLSNEIQPMSLDITSYIMPDADFSYYDPKWNVEGSAYEGSCGQVAATATLAYLQAVFGIGMPSFFVSNPYYLFLSLLDIIPHDTNNYGTSPSQMITGLNSFAKKNKYTYKASYNSLTTTSYNKYKTTIKNDIPALIDTTNHPKYGEHWAIGIGYRTVNYDGHITYQCVVDDGWGNPEVFISNKYVEGILFINPQ